MQALVNPNAVALPAAPHRGHRQASRYNNLFSLRAVEDGTRAGAAHASLTVHPYYGDSERLTPQLCLSSFLSRRPARPLWWQRTGLDTIYAREYAFIVFPSGDCILQY